MPRYYDVPDPCNCGAGDCPECYPSSVCEKEDDAFDIPDDYCYEGDAWEAENRW